MILNCFHYSIFAKSAWHKNGGVSITPFLFIFIFFVHTHFEIEDVVSIDLVPSLQPMQAKLTRKVKRKNFTLNFKNVSMLPKRNEEQQFMWSDDEVELFYADLGMSSQIFVHHAHFQVNVQQHRKNNTNSHKWLGH